MRQDLSPSQNQLMSEARSLLLAMTTDRPPLTPEDERRLLLQAITGLPIDPAETWQGTTESGERHRSLKTRLRNLLAVYSASPRYYREMRQRLLHAAAHQLRDWNVAEDLVQETFVHMFQRADQFRGDSSHSTWLHSILFNRIQTWRRGRGAVLESALATQPGDNTPDMNDFLLFLQDRPVEGVISEEMLASREKLGKVLELIPVLLTDRYSCQAINLLYIQHLSYEEAARRLNIRKDHLYKVVSTAREKLLLSSRIKAILED